MIREKVTYKDYFKIAKEHEYFLWHFVQKNQDKSVLTIKPIFDGEKEKNELSIILEELDIPYFESYTEDSLDFLMGLGIQYEKLYTPILPNPNILSSFKFSPILIGFKGFSKVSTTMETCYCAEGIINVISKLDPKYLEQILTNIEKNPD